MDNDVVVRKMKRQIILVGLLILIVIVSYGFAIDCDKNVELNDSYNIHGFEKSAWENGTWLYYHYNKTINGTNGTNTTVVEEGETFCPTDICIKKWEEPGWVYLEHYNETCKLNFERWLYG